MIPLLPAKTPFTPAEYIDRIHCMDALAYLRLMPSNSIDMILTDPPYGVHEASWDNAPDMPVLWVEMKRVLKDRSAVVFTAVQPFTSDLITSNREWFKYCLVWAKSMAGDFFNAKNKPLRTHEDIVVFSNGTVANGSPNRMQYYPQGIVRERKKHSRPYSAKFRRESEQIVKTRPNWKTEYESDYTNYPGSVLYFQQGNNDTYHPNQKPVNLFEYLICTYTQPDAVVLDMFMGSGTTAIAARNTGRHFTGCELNPDYMAMIERRLSVPFTLPMMFEMETERDNKHLVIETL